MSDKLTIEEVIQRKEEISSIVFDNNVFMAQSAEGETITERDCVAALREYFSSLGFDVLDA